MRRFLIALQFLTILPLSNKQAADEDTLAKSSSFFVIVGIFQGLLLVITDYGTGRLFHPDLVAAFILLVLVLSNGGFHLDGLADTFDALAIKSQGKGDTDRQKRLSVMKTGTVGPAGVAAMVFSLALKYLALKNLAHLLPFTYLSSLIIMPVFSKWAMVVSMFHGKPARNDGLGKIFISRAGWKELILSTIGLLMLLLFLEAIFSFYAADNQYIFYALSLAVIYFFCRIGIICFHKRFGGLTGDTLGAISEMTELIFLLMVIVWSRLFLG